ncbi:MAG: ABC transporter ATP-binding protein [Thermotogota bacterium]
MSVLKISNVEKSYGKGETKIKALKNMNLTVNEGEFMSIVGPSGSGKSTLLNILGCIDNPTYGEIFIENENVTKLNDKQMAIFRRRKLGFIFQFYNLIPVLTAEENVLFPLMLDNRKADINYIYKIMDILKIKHRKNHFPQELSGGEQQRFAIARALATKPSLILADEPTGNLDSKNSEEVINLMIEMHKKFNQTIIMVTHNHEIAEIASRKIELVDGEIVSDERMLKNG